MPKWVHGYDIYNNFYVRKSGPINKRKKIYGLALLEKYEARIKQLKAENNMLHKESTGE